VASIKRHTTFRAPLATG